MTARPFWLDEIWRFARAWASALTATAVDWVLMSALIKLGANLYVAVGLGALAGAITDFSIKRGWVFEARGGMLRGQIWRYVLASALSLGWNEVFTFVAVAKLGLPKIPGAIAAAVVVGTVWNYPVHRLFVFRRPRASTAPPAEINPP